MREPRRSLGLPVGMTLYFLLSGRQARVGDLWCESTGAFGLFRSFFRCLDTDMIVEYPAAAADCMLGPAVSELVADSHSLQATMGRQKSSRKRF